MPLLNDFLLGADPEFAIINNGHLQRGREPERYSPWGLDHGAWVIEPHPKPDKSVRQLVKNIRVAMNDFAVNAPLGTWRAGAYLHYPERNLTLGGHVHLDLPKHTDDQITALDTFTNHLEHLNILPTQECNNRREEGAGYGRWSDIRAEHGHFEYRTMCSWLFSQRVTKICLTGAKLCMVDPEGPATMGRPNTASLTKLHAFFERFKRKDDDVDWLLESDILRKKLVVNPSKDLREVWKVIPEQETPHWKEEEAKKKQQVQREAPAVLFAERFYTVIEGWVVMTQAPLLITNPRYERIATYIRENTRLMFPGHNAVISGVVSFVGRVGAQWQLYDTRSVRVSIGGTRHVFRVLPHFMNTPDLQAWTRTTLRDAVITARQTPPPGTFQLHNGLVFHFVRTEEPFWDDDVETEDDL